MPSKGKLADFRLSENGFEIKGQSYCDSQIRHIFVGRKNTVTKVNFAYMGEVHAIKVVITLITNQALVLQETEGGGLISAVISDFLGQNQSKVVGLAEAVEVLMKRTFEHRLSIYLKELETHGYFTRDECRFYPRDKIVFRDKVFALQNTTFLKGPGHIELRAANFSIFHKIKRELTLTKIPQFNTQTDGDVIFTLLDRFFGLRWE